MSGDRAPSGIPGLDALLEGGFPRGRVILINGEPGAGKTIFATQFLINGILQYGENGIFVSLEESHSHFRREISRLGWPIDELEKQKKLAFVDGTNITYLPEVVKVGKTTMQRKEYSMLGILQQVTQEAGNIGAKRIAVDSVTSLSFQFYDPVQRRNAVMQLVETLSKTGATCVVTNELKSSDPFRTLEVEDYISHGLVVLQSILIGRSYTRVLRIHKMRETSIDMQPRPYRITSSGLEVLAHESVYA